MGKKKEKKEKEGKRKCFLDMFGFAR